MRWFLTHALVAILASSSPVGCASSTTQPVLPTATSAPVPARLAPPLDKSPAARGRGEARPGLGAEQRPSDALVQEKVRLALLAHKGLGQEQVRSVVIANPGAVRACYESEAKRNPSLEGGVTVAWRVAPSGAVSDVSLAATTLSNPRVEGCIVREVEHWRFPPSDGVTIISGFPFKFGVGG